ncbi:hypothetical protein SKAU_G00215140 [Synaphobranchus kaupii]|uniref:Uncharacterized protein n=1 Tax=Synaphobranchus kaupii TaxID=118154 RepID=A0A9Q1F9X6_SYNKA|nr:hypothetical protein SKAU_G00215140 [Synaphobranchus kaupii]
MKTLLLSLPGQLLVSQSNCPVLPVCYLWQLQLRLVHQALLFLPWPPVRPRLRCSYPGLRACLLSPGPPRLMSPG